MTYHLMNTLPASALLNLTLGHEWSPADRLLALECAVARRLLPERTYILRRSEILASARRSAT